MLNYEIYGKGSRVIVFLHGFMSDINALRGIANGLEGNSRVILVDFGFREEPARPLTLADYVNGVREILNNEMVSEAYFVCHSFGGRVGIRLASNYPHLVKGMVLIGSAGLKPRRGLCYYFKVGLHKILKKLGKSGLKGSADYKDLMPNQKGTFINIVNDFTDRDLKYITAKVLLIWGSKDRATPLYMARRYLRKLPNATLKILEGCSHFCYLEKRGETLSLIRAYISGDE